MKRMVPEEKPRCKMAAGNWKMNGLAAMLPRIDALVAAHPAPGCDILICPPATLLHRAADLLGDSPITLGGQDCHTADTGAHTGDISAAMLADAGATHVILGHSERRADHGESDSQVRAKAKAVLAAGLAPVICIGETLAERAAGRTLEVLGAQLAGSVPDGADAATVIAYEPVWAIGTGKVPTPARIAKVHSALRAALVARFGAAGNAMRLLYGGSVRPDNAAGMFAIGNVDGALVGGASLQAADFSAIITALEDAG